VHEGGLPSTALADQGAHLYWRVTVTVLQVMVMVLQVTVMVLQVMGMVLERVDFPPPLLPTSTHTCSVMVLEWC
jgi:hypothetical protein